MSIDKHFHMTPDAHGGVTLTPRRAIRTADGRMLTTAPNPIDRWLSWTRGSARDTLLSAETTPKNPTMMGRVWAGNLRSQLIAMSATDRASAVQALGGLLGEFSGAGAHNAGSAGSTDDEPYIGSGASPQSINDSNRAFWDRANKSVTRDVALPELGRPVSIEALQRMNDNFWADQTEHQRGSEKVWGKG